MRKLNAVLTAAIMLLFLAHAILGGFQLLGVGSTAVKALAWICVGLIAVHTVIGIRLTADTLRVRKKTGVGYFRENTLFCARRVSGFAVMVLLVFHITAFGDNSGAQYRLRWFDTAKLITQLLLTGTLALHILSNVKPVLISFGVRRLKERAGDILLILSVLLLFMAAAFIVYYIRWNSF
mgnify:CR=1 FL=1